MSALTSVEGLPELEGDAREAVAYRGGHLQLIASAGAGKTEVVAQRVAHLVFEGVPPSAIVAFTFTEKAATELKARIDRRAAALAGADVLDRIGTMFVGTIHSYAFRLLQERVPRYEVFDVLDDHRLVAFLSREAYRLGVSDLDAKLYQAIARFGEAVQVIENELIPDHRLPQPFRTVFRRYREALENSRLMTYGQMIVHAVEALDDEAVRGAVHPSLRHVIVDEYQDINPAEEAMIERLVAGGAHLCVVGDDQQAIYQWRGSTVENILTFADRYASVRTFKLETNRRSRPQIISAARGFGDTITARLPKQMLPHRQGSGGVEVSTWVAPTRSDEAAAIASTIRFAHDELGYAYRDIAILCRLKASFGPILDALTAADIPVQPGGRTALFDQPEAELFGKTICWLVDYDWRTSRYGWNTEQINTTQLLDTYTTFYNLNEDATGRVAACLDDWKTSVDDETGPANLVRRFYELLQAADVDEWEVDDKLVVNRMGTLARCSQLLADYEMAARRSRSDPDAPGEQRGARDRGRQYYEWLARYVQNWARGAYEAFEGEEDIELDAVDLLTVHKAKGLEWPIVFVPALTVGGSQAGGSASSEAGSFHATCSMQLATRASTTTSVGSSMSPSHAPETSPPSVASRASRTHASRRPICSSWSATRRSPIRRQRLRHLRRTTRMTTDRSRSRSPTSQPTTSAASRSDCVGKSVSSRTSSPKSATAAPSTTSCDTSPKPSERPTGPPRSTSSTRPSTGGQNGNVIGVVFNPSGTELLTTSTDGKLRLWDLASGKLVGAPLPGADTGGWGTFTPDGKQVIAAFWSGTGVAWNVDPAAWKAQACQIAHRNLTHAEWSDFLPGRRYRRVCP